jgi:hypothetical protein
MADVKPTWSPAQKFFIDLLRSFLTMRYQKAAGSTYELADAKLGDEELWEDLRFGLLYFNSAPPTITTYSYKDLYVASEREKTQGGDPTAPESESVLSILIGIVMLCALFYTSMRLQWFEAGKHFQFNDNGISIVRDKQPKYQAIAGPILQEMTRLSEIKRSLSLRNFRMKGLFSGMISHPRSLTRGLRGTRLGR